MSHLLPHTGKKPDHHPKFSLAAGAAPPGPITIEGSKISLRLNKSQIDKVSIYTIFIWDRKKFWVHYTRIVDKIT
jgi:hypothetical protein